ncbi:MAG: hypothetical protein ACXWFX_08990 [Methylobacter sp.]
MLCKLDKSIATKKPTLRTIRTVVEKRGLSQEVSGLEKIAVGRIMRA